MWRWSLREQIDPKSLRFAKQYIRHSHLPEDEVFLKIIHIIIVSLVGAALLVALGVIVSFRAFEQMKDAAEARKLTFGVLNSAGDWLSAMKDAETGQRGYLLTGDETFLQPYTSVQDHLSRDLVQLRQLTLNSAAQRHLDALAPLLDEKMAEMAHVIELRRNQDMPAVLEIVRSGQGKQVMDSIRGEMRSFIQIEDGALAQHEADFQSTMRLLFAIIVCASLLTLLLALSFTYLFYRGAQQRLNNVLHRETQHLLAIREETNRQLQQANMTLQVSEEKLAVTLNSIGDAVIATDSDGRVTRLNPRAEQLTGWLLAEAAGHPVDDIFHIINEATRLPATVPVKETLAKGTIHGLANHTVLIARDGSECAIADSCAPIRDRDARVVGAVLVFRDVAAEYAAQQALRDQQFYTRSLIESSIDALMTTDPAGFITDVNQQMVALAGCTSAELLGAPFKSCFTDPARAAAGIALVLRENKVTDYELTARARDGKETVVSFNATTFYDRDQKLRGVFAAARDVTERKRLDQVLQRQHVELESAKSVAEKANLAKSDFLASMSHELRTPLNAILGFAQLMETDSPVPTAGQKESIGQILRAGWHLLNLINEVLDLAVIESGKVSLSREAVSLEEVMSECRALVEPQAQPRGISMTFPRFASPVYVSVDRTRLKQIIINLLSNAIKYNKERGAVIVTCTTSTPGRTRISVQDTGAGLSPEKLAQLFQPFNRLGQEAGGVAGTGIGLVVIKRLAEVMGGVLGVESTVGVGSVFWCELLSSAAPQLIVEPGDAASVDEPPAPNGARLRTLLYVEDNPANLKLVEQLIARYPDLRLLTAVNATFGLAVARTSQPAVILMDINLPGISGIQALKALRDDPSTAHIPIVAISANAMPRDIEKGLAAGFFRYLTKPIKVKEFMDTLQVALEHAKESKP